MIVLSTLSLEKRAMLSGVIGAGQSVPEINKKILENTKTQKSHEAMYRTTVLFGWLKAINQRIENLGGKIKA